MPPLTVPVPALVFALLLVLPGCAATQASGTAVEVSARAVALHPTDPTVSEVGRLTYRGGVHLRAHDSRFAELSALRILPDGERIVAVTDRGHWLTARLQHDARGVLQGLVDVHMDALRDADGRALQPPWSDAEALAVTPDGTKFVGFERHHRIWRYPPADPPFSGPPEPLPTPPGLERAPFNEGIEAMTLLPDGRLFVLTEGLFDADGDIVGWVGGEKGWSPLRYRPGAGLVPTGAAVLPSGDVLVLERGFGLVSGFRIRVARVAAAAIRSDARLQGEELALLAPPLSVDNFEGIDVRVTEAGKTLIYLLSDNNRLPFQRTLLLQFELNE
jgi:hypothetical protein